MHHVRMVFAFIAAIACSTGACAEVVKNTTIHEALDNQDETPGADFPGIMHTKIWSEDGIVRMKESGGFIVELQR